MKVLITGAGGFLGRHLSEKLMAAGHGVVGLDLRLEPPLAPGCEPVLGSVTEPETVARAIKGCDAVIHAAAVTGLWAQRRTIFHEVNVEGTRIVLDAAEAEGISAMVQVSSFVTLIAGGRGPVETVDERLELPVEAMLGAYPRSKREAELICRAHAVDPVIVLPSAPIGPGDYGPTPPGRLLEDLANRKLPALLDCTWNFIGIEALAEGVIAALMRGVPGRRYLLSGENLTTAEMVKLFEVASSVPVTRWRVPHGVALASAHLEERLAAITGLSPKGPLTGVRPAGPRRRFDNARARAELDFDPPPVIDAFRAAIEWMRKYYRIPQM
ncbi:MAG: NAD-dependent epimerase/dehydratase family protein [Pseudomonadota bacterium]